MMATRRIWFAAALILPVQPLMAQNGSAATPPLATPALKDGNMHHATGSFTVKLEPQKDEIAPTPARMTIDKHFTGDLEASSKGQMLSAMGEVKGSAGYVAIEKVTGTLQGHAGSFVLQHNATMDRGAPYLNIIVVPDSGTGELVGITGAMKIIIADGKHSYEFDYALKP